MTTNYVEKKLHAINGHSMELEKLVSQLETDIEKGLTDEKAAQKLEEYGLNQIPKPKQSFWQVYLAPLLNTLIVIYLIMTSLILILALIYLLLNPEDTSIWLTAAQWLVIVAVNFAIAIIQQARAQKKIEALHKMAAPMAIVIRNGEEKEINTEDVVPGDVIKISQGDKIPADARIIKSSSLRVNESSLTGESVPATKFEEGEVPIADDTPIGERKNMLFNGTYATMGSGRAVVVNTGGNTEFGKISLELEELNTGDIPIRQKVNTIGNYLVGGMLVIFSLLVVYQGALILSDNQDTLKQLAAGTLDPTIAIEFFGELVFKISSVIITAMSVVPINIPLLTTIVLITGVLAMAKHKVIIRNLASIESLGRISVLCSDKTGTITAGQMTVKRVWDATEDKHYYVTGLGYSPEGKIIQLEDEKETIDEKQARTRDPISANHQSSLGMMIISGLLNNDSKIIEEYIEATKQKIYNGTGSPTESALLTLFHKTKFDELLVKNEYKLVREYPFDSSLKRMSKIFETDKKEMYVFTKGATEVILPKCVHIGFDEKKQRVLKEEDRTLIMELVEKYAGQGYRLLSFAYKKLDNLPEKDDKERDKIETELSYLGFVTVLDPPRDRVDESVNETRLAGITPIMITGDSPLTAASIANSIGMVYNTQHQTHEGKMAAKLNDLDFRNTRVFARVAPQDKQIIVERYQKQNRIVAMTGDGVNDALALSMADAGIAMGIAGTEVSKQAADLVIADDSFNSIVTGIREGRALFQRIRVIIFFYVCLNLAEAAIYIGSSFLSEIVGPNVYFALMDNLQRAYIFGIAHTFPPLALIVDRIPRDIMDRDPIDTAGIFNKKLALTLAITSITLAAIVYLVYFTCLFGFIPVNGVNESFYIPAFQDPTKAGTGLRPIDMSAFGQSQLSHAKARTLMHTILYLTIPLVILSIRRIDKSLLAAIKEDSWWMTYLLVFSIIPIHLALMYIPAIQTFLASFNVDLDVIALSIDDWILCIIAASIPIIALESAKWYNRYKGQFY
ncbi:MAG: cation-translocating P-type ATPase [Candidatus Hodarchaeota archaeon]